MFPGMGELRGHRDLILMLRTGLRDLKKTLRVYWKSFD